MRQIAILLVPAALALVPAAARAQQPPEPSLDILEPSLVAPKSDFILSVEPDAFAPETQTPDAGDLLSPALAGDHELRLEARLTAAGAPVEDGLVWRLFSMEPDSDGALQQLWTARGGSAAVILPAGVYIVHASFGQAAETRQFSITDGNKRLSLVLNAGGLRLDATAGEGGFIPPDHLTFDIMEAGANQAGGDEPPAILVSQARPGTVLRLPAGTYHVVSRYGEVNSIVRADIEVTAGKLTEAIMRHNAAEVTLKLVSTEGGEALANTSWTVLTAGGDTVHESVGAFPSLVLAEGAYTAVAAHQGDIYSREFTVEPGVDREVDVRLADLVPPDSAGGPGGLEP